MLTDPLMELGEPDGIWIASANLLGLEGPIDAEPYERVEQGLHPETAQPLVLNAGKEGRVTYFDIVFSAPKYVSMLWARANASERELIERAHETAARDAIDCLETNFAWSRTGKAGSGPRVRAKLIVAAWPHHTSREDEPNLHIHANVMNISICADGATRALDGMPILRTKKLSGARYRARLAHELTKLGYQCQRERDFFRICGVPEDVVDEFSTRSRQIKGHQQKHGTSGAAAAEIANFETRKEKTDEIALEPLALKLKRWQASCDDLGWKESDTADLRKPRQIDRQKSLERTVKQTLKNLTDKHQHFTELDLLREAYIESANYGLHPDDVVPAVKALLRESPEIQKIAVAHGPTRYTTKEKQREEEALIRDFGELAESHATMPGLLTVHRAIGETERANGIQLTVEQFAAVKYLTRGRGRVKNLHGNAGTGKTSAVLGPVIKAYQAAGRNVIAATVTGKAAIKLSEQADIETFTLSKLLGDWHLPLKEKIKRELDLAIRQVTAPPQPTTLGRSLRRAARSFGKYRPKRHQPKSMPIPKGSVVIIDEASNISIRRWQRLADYVKQYGALLIVAGDYNQQPPVEGFPAFKSLCRQFGHATVTEIKRQKHDWQRRAANHFPKGEVVEALTLYAEHNCLHRYEHVDEVLDEAVNKWQSIGGALNPKSAVILAHSNDYVTQLNRKCQQARLRSGYLKSASVPISDEQQGFNIKDRVYIGEEVIFTANAKRLRVRDATFFGIANGTRGTVIDIGGKLGSPLILVRLDDKENTTTLIPTAEFKAIRLGYACTNFKIQGDTIDHALVVLGGPMQDLPNSYVQFTRARISTHLFTTKRLLPDLNNIAASPLAGQMQEQPELRLISELRLDYQEIVLESDRGKRVDQVIADFEKLVASSVNAIITPDEDEAKVINQKIQASRFEKSGIANHERCGDTDFKRATRCDNKLTSFYIDGAFYLPGDRVRMTRNAREFERGDLGTITGFSFENEAAEKGDRMEIRLDSTRHVVSVVINTHNPAATHAFAITPEQARGRSFTNVFELPPDPIVQPVLKYFRDSYRVGDQVRFIGEMKPIDVKAEERATIIRIDPAERRVFARLGNGREVDFQVTSFHKPPIQKLTNDWKSLIANNRNMLDDEIRSRLSDAAIAEYQTHVRAREQANMEEKVRNKYFKEKQAQVERKREKIRRELEEAAQATSELELVRKARITRLREALADVHLELNRLLERSKESFEVKRKAWYEEQMHLERIRNQLRDAEKAGAKVPDSAWRLVNQATTIDFQDPGILETNAELLSLKDRIEYQLERLVYSPPGQSAAEPGFDIEQIIENDPRGWLRKIVRQGEGTYPLNTFVRPTPLSMDQVMEDVEFPAAPSPWKDNVPSPASFSPLPMVPPGAFDTPTYESQNITSYQPPPVGGPTPQMSTNVCAGGAQQSHDNYWKLPTMPPTVEYGPTKTVYTYQYIREPTKREPSR